MDFENLSFLREVYSGSEYIESSLESSNGKFDKYLIRAIPKSWVKNFLDFVVHVNKFAHVDNTLVPAIVEERDDFFIVKFKYSKERPLTTIIDKLSYENTSRIVELFVQYLYGVENGIYPPVPYISLEDIFIYAGEFFFLPPLLYSNKLLRDVTEKRGDKLLFVAPEFLDTGVCTIQSTFYTVGKVIEFLDKSGKYSDLAMSLTHKNPTDRKVPVHWFEEFVFIDNQLIKNIESKIVDEILQSKQHIFTLQISTQSYKHFRNILSSLHKVVNRQENSMFICIQDDFTNLPRQLLSKYGDILEDDEIQSLLPALYANTKFGSILPTIISVLNKAKVVFLIIDDVVNSDYLIRTFLSHLETFRTTSKIVIVTKNSKQADIDFIVSSNHEEIEEKKCGLELYNLDPQGKLLTTLGKKFRRNEMNYLEKITNTNYEKYLEEFLKCKIIHKEGNEYVFDEKLWEKLYNEIPTTERRTIHLKLAKKLSNLSDPYNVSLLKNAYHYIMAERDISAAVVYLNFVRKNLETYTFSTERMKEALTSAYEILKKHNKSDSYSFNSILLKFKYQSLETIDFSVPEIPDNKFNKFLVLLNDFVNERYREVIEKFHRFFEKPNLSDLKFKNFKQLYAYLLYQYSYYNLNDKLEDEKFFKDLVDNIPEFNKSWLILKSEYILLYVISAAYRNRNEALRYVEKAREIIEKSNAKHLLIRFENEVGIINDMAAISIENFRHAIQIAAQIGYPKRSFVPYVNLLRALLYFGFFDELKEEIKRSQNYISLWKNISDLAFYYRILAFLPMYEQRYKAADELLKKSLHFEKSNNLQQASLRGIILNELICGNLENAKRIIHENKDNPAIKTRAFEYLVKLSLAQDDEEFRNVWNDYRNSPYHLLREEILYIFAERISSLDEEGFISELQKWEGMYTAGGVNLSLFYVLLAKYRYFISKGNKIRSEIVKSEICNLMRIMKGFEHPFEKECTNQELDNIKPLLHIFKRLDFKVSLDDFVKLFASEIYRIFKPQKLHVEVSDKLTNISHRVSNINKLPEDDMFNIHPLELSIRDRIDEFSSYHIYIYSEEFNVSNRKNLENTITLMEELFIGQLKGIILRERSNIDSLTGLYNRWKFNQLMDEELNRKNVLFSVFVMDIDDFKKINDTYGHIVGDKVLKEISIVLKNLTGSFGITARYGGEEFVGLLYLDKFKAIELCNSIRESIFKMSIDEFGFKVTVSIGVADSTEKITRSELLGLADQRLYKAKNSGKDMVVSD